MRIRNALLAAGRGLGMAVASQVVSIGLYVLAMASIGIIPAGVGLYTTPGVLRAVRRHAAARRRLAAEWSDVRIESPYRPLPATGNGVVAGPRLSVAMLSDPATWRDIGWLLIDMTAGFTVALLPAGLIAQGLFGIVQFLGVWRPLAHFGGDWYLFVHVTSQLTAGVAALLGLLLIAAGLRVAEPVLRGYFLLARVLLAPSRELDAALRRVDRLTETRSEALDASAAELRRIERDLHDGAQARLVAMGMTLGAAERLVRDDPEAAARLLVEARNASATALGELRDLVRGIHPPVLAERGLGDAVRALAMASPLTTEVAVDVPGRLPAPVESAAYFAVSEILTNAAKHADARRVWIDLRHQDGALRATVTDDGQGGATLDAPDATGLRGVERRLAVFDGVLAVSSPIGGPTSVTMDVPCTPLPGGARAAAR